MKRVKHPNYIGIILCRSANNQSYYLVIVTDFINGIHNLLTFDGIFILIRTSASTKNKATYDFEIARMSETFYGGKIELFSLVSDTHVALTNRSLYVLPKH